jgi:hypothetical protein
MKKHSSILFLFLIIGIETFAQNEKLRVYQTIGVNISKNALKNDSSKDTRKACFGWNNRMVAEFSASSKFSIGVGFGYCSRREKTMNYAISDFFGKKIAETDLIFETNSLNLPVFIKYSFSESSFRPYIKVGIRNDFLLKMHTYCGDIRLIDPAYADDVKFYAFIQENTISGDDFESFELNRYLVGPELSVGFVKHGGNRLFFGGELTFDRSLRNLHSTSTPSAFAQSCCLSILAGINL